MEDIGATATRIVLGALSSHIDDDNVERRETTDVADIMDAFELAGVVRRIGVDDLDGGNRRPGGSVGLTPTGAVCVRRLLAADCDACCGRKVRRLQRDGPAVVHRWEGLPHRQRGGDGVACCPPARRSSRPDVRCGSGARRSSLAGWPTRRARRSPSDAARGVLPEPHAPGGPIFQTPNAGATCCIRRHQVSKVDGDTMPLRWGMAYQRPNIADVGLGIGKCLCVRDDSGALTLPFGALNSSYVLRSTIASTSSPPSPFQPGTSAMTPFSPPSLSTCVFARDGLPPLGRESEPIPRSVVRIGDAVPPRRRVRTQPDLVCPAGCVHHRGRIGLRLAMLLDR